MASSSRFSTFGDSRHASQCRVVLLSESFLSEREPMQIHFTDFVTAANLLVLLGIYRKMSIIVYQHKLMWTDFADAKASARTENMRPVFRGGNWPRSLAANEHEYANRNMFQFVYSDRSFAPFNAKSFQVNSNETYSKRKISGQGLSRAGQRLLAVARAWYRSADMASGGFEGKSYVAHRRGLDAFSWRDWLGPGGLPQMRCAGLCES